MQVINYEDQIKDYEADTELQDLIKYFAEVMSDDHIIHEGTSIRLYSLLQDYSGYLKRKIAEYSDEAAEPDDFMDLAKYDCREGNFYYMFDTRYLTPPQAENRVNAYLDKKFADN
ncbi:hypothetical protein [Ignatzschineria cameli]|uniref:Uncharacterized protein n=1 Tax=Ignatzschineria cameli TaxID=2182793 RepID=A0A2U2AQ75_9GAMM|nr:hypothetical protein [Ignatzschineria cameli]PWD85790.1 hypothetical protein DC077_07080 [Ignatzschineria cameli]PWD89418.1 hypothetical protein DC079_06705 [Ignatzschineria cameli]PWD90890.1 hypothetical protein DC081_06415 [Ignatzschineria cameli]PWD91678.1 hypothetical protein DC078_06700 [Ignatzschineria cameli]